MFSLTLRLDSKLKLFLFMKAKNLLFSFRILRVPAIKKVVMNIWIHIIRCFCIHKHCTKINARSNRIDLCIFYMSQHIFEFPLEQVNSYFINGNLTLMVKFLDFLYDLFFMWKISKYIVSTYIYGIFSQNISNTINEWLLTFSTLFAIYWSKVFCIHCKYSSMSSI